MAIEVNGYTIQPGADLSGADLSGADLSNMDLSEIEFDGANLTNANLSGSNLHYSSLDENTNLSGADLSNVSFYGDGTANGISGVSYANFNGGKFSNVADLSGTDFTNLFLLNTNFSGLDLTGISFKSATLDRADFSNSNLSGADFGDTKASATTFTGAILDGANFYNAVHETYMPSYESIVSGRVLDDAVGSYVMDEDFSVSKVPIPTIDLNDADGIVDAVEVKSWVGVTGTAFPGSQVELISTLTETGGNMSFYVDVDADGKWSMPYEGNNFPDGTYALSFRTLHDGNQSDEVKTTLELSQIKHTPFKITADGGKYYIDGVLTPELELVSGHTYQFDLSDSSLNTHPLRFNMDGSPWSDGVEVTGTLGQDQMVVISIPSASKGVLSYYCTNHSGMGNDCDIIGNTIAGTDEIDVIYGLAGDDVISAGFGADMIYADAGDDTIVLSASDTYHSFYKAANRSSDLQTGTEERVSLKGMLKVEHSADGGFGTDTIKLDEGNIAYFLHDSYSDFYWQQSFATDTLGNTSAPRFFGIEKITGSDGNNIIDLTSPDYSLAEQSIEVDGGLGADIIWGSDANETIKGGDGDDELFGGAGTNVLTGGLGADEFQFTMTSKNDSVTDFNAAEGDTLKFFNTGGATFDRDSVTANSEGDGISIEYSHNDQVQSLNISLGLSSSSVTNDLLSAIEII